MSNVGRTSLIGEYISTTLPEKVFLSDIPLETIKSNISQSRKEVSPAEV